MTTASTARFTTIAAIAALTALSVLLPASLAGAKSQSAAVRLVNPKPADAGEKVRLLANDDFKVTGDCEDYGGGDYGANSFLKGKRDNLAYTTYSPELGFPKFDDDYDIADGAIDFSQTDANGTMPMIEEAEYYEFYGEGKRGRVFKGHMATTVHHRGADCNLGGVFFDATKAGPLQAVDRIKVDVGATKTLFTNKSMKLTGECQEVAAGNYRANTFLRARHAPLAYYLTEYDSYDTNLGPGDPKVDLFPAADDANGTALDFVADSYSNDFITLNKHGRLLQGRLASAVHARSADCTYSAMLTGPQSGGPLHVVNGIEADGGKNVKIFENDDFRVSGRCKDNGGGDFTADTFMQTKHNNAAYEAYDYGEDVDFDKDDGKIDFASGDATGPMPMFISEDQYADFWAESAQGKALTGRAVGGVNILGADCVFAGYYIG